MIFRFADSIHTFQSFWTTYILSTPASRLESLTGLRAILAVMVVICHGWIRTDPLPPENIWSRIILESGHCGVAGFFVLSGYILAHVYRDRPWSSREFVVNRVARIYPLYLLGILFTLPLDWNSPGMPSEGRTEALGLSFILQQSWFPFARGRFNGPGWTLSVEAVFYALFPILFLIWKRRPSLFAALSVSTGLITAFLWNPSSFFQSHQFPLMRVWEFMFGMALAMVHFRKPWPIREFVPLALVLASPVFAALLEGNDPPFAKWAVMVIVAGISILLLAAVDSEHGAPSFLRLKWMVIGGEISYGLYLLHMGVQRYSRVAFERFFDAPLKESTLTIKMTYLLSTSVASLLLAFICWKLVEIPARSFLRKKLAPHGST